MFFARIVLVICLFASCVGQTNAAQASASHRAPGQTEKAAEDEWDNLAFRIEDSKVYVGIAAVKLSVSELRSENGQLLGEYSIQVPLKRSKNDRGRIVLAIDRTVEELAANGGVLRGNAYSSESDGAPKQVICEVRPHDNQGIRLAITTEDRVLKFSSNYTVTDRNGDGERSL